MNGNVPASWLAVRPRVVQAAAFTGMAEQRLRTSAVMVPIGRQTTQVSLPSQAVVQVLAQLIGAQEQIDLAMREQPAVLSFLNRVQGVRVLPVSYQLATLVRAAGLGAQDTIEMGSDQYSQILNDIVMSRQFLDRLAEVLSQPPGR